MKNVRIGLTADLFGSTCRPVFGTEPLQLFADAGLTWDVLPADDGIIAPQALASYDALFIGGSRISEPDLKSDTGRLRVLARNGVGFDALDISALTARGILVTNTPVAVRHSVATTALAFILALSLRLPLKSQLSRDGRWSERGDFPGVGLPGRTIGIVGFGGIGQELVRLLQPFGLRTFVADPFADPVVCANHGVELIELDHLLGHADFIVIACLLNDTTRHLINAARIALMKPTAFLINVARGPVIEESALINALRSGSIAGAGLDVLEKEPPDPDNPLLFMENAIVTPHSLCWTDTFLDGVARCAIKSILDVIDGTIPEFVVNRTALSHPRVKGWQRN
jgi:phosphoglycerate dehydrogenase-like enzyme